MRLNKSDLIKKLRLGEGSFIECKEVRFSGDKVTGPHKDSLADELAAFANSAIDTGVLLLGVHDKSREVLGLPSEKLDLVFIWVRNICLDVIKPPLTPVIERITLPDNSGKERPIIRIDIPKSLFVHKSPGGYFHRVGDSKREMSPEYLARLMEQRSQSRIIRFDEQIVPGASIDDLKPDLYERFKTARSRDTNESLLSKLAMIREDSDGLLRPTVSGILLATSDPQKWLPNAYIQAVAYRGSEISAVSGSSYQLDARDITGPLDQQVLEACRFIKKNIRTSAKKQEGRIDIPQFDFTAVFEAVVNAVAHRDYSIYESKIRLRIYKDRLEIYSPGSIANSMTVESLAYRQAARNETISSLLAKCKVPSSEEYLTDRSSMMDKRGEGVPIILERSERLSGITPEYTLIDHAELLLTIYAGDIDND